MPSGLRGVPRMPEARAWSRAPSAEAVLPPARTRAARTGHTAPLATARGPAQPSRVTLPVPRSRASATAATNCSASRHHRSRRRAGSPLRLAGSRTAMRGPVGAPAAGEGRAAPGMKRWRGQAGALFPPHGIDDLVGRDRASQGERADAGENRALLGAWQLDLDLLRASRPRANEDVETSRTMLRGSPRLLGRQRRRPPWTQGSVFPRRGVMSRRGHSESQIRDRRPRRQLPTVSASGGGTSLRSSGSANRMERTGCPAAHRHDPQLGPRRRRSGHRAVRRRAARVRRLHRRPAVPSASSRGFIREQVSALREHAHRGLGTGRQMTRFGRRRARSSIRGERSRRRCVLFTGTGSTARRSRQADVDARAALAGAFAPSATPAGDARRVHRAVRAPLNELPWRESFADVVVILRTPTVASTWNASKRSWCDTLTGRCGSRRSRRRRT